MNMYIYNRIILIIIRIQILSNNDRVIDIY